MKCIFIRKLWLILVVLLMLTTVSTSKNAWAVSYQYDALNRLTSVADENGNSFNYTYNAGGNITSVVKVESGVCGSADGQTLPVAPTGSLCAAGSATAVNGNGPWTWSCIGIGGGSTANCSAQIYTWSLTTLFSGSGGGSINGDISCTSDSTCPAATFSHGSSVTLTALPDAYSTFGSWSGDCAGTGTCNLTMDNNKSVTATFSANTARVKIDGLTDPYYAIDPTLYLITAGTKIVYTKDSVFTENVIMTSPAVILLKGGYIDTAFTSRSTGSHTIIDGSLKVRKGTLRVELVKVR